MRLNLSENLRRNVRGTYGAAGDAWLEALPAELDAACAAWGLGSLAAYPVQSFNHVAKATDSTGRAVVLKQSFPSRDSRFEAIAMEAFSGTGAPKVLRVDRERGWMLLERLEPGATLLTLPGEEARIRAVCGVVQGLWSVPVERGEGLPHIRELFELLNDVLEREDLRSEPALMDLVVKAGQIFEAIQDDRKDRILHGDLHHFNIINDGQRWAVIDAKGVIGNPLYDLGAYLRNPLVQAERPTWDELVDLRVTRFAETLGVEKALVAQWGFCVAVLRALWGLVLGFSGWQKELEDSSLFLRHFLDAPGSKVVY